MLRTQLNDELKGAMKARDKCAVSTIRLVLAAIKDRDIAARGQGGGDKISNERILKVLQKMVRQRKDSIEMYAKGGRPDLVDREKREIEVVETFLPKPLDESEVHAAVEGLIAELGAETIKQMGQVMAELKRRYAGRMDFAKASALVKKRLA